MFFVCWVFLLFSFCVFGEFLFVCLFDFDVGFVLFAFAVFVFLLFVICFVFCCLLYVFVFVFGLLGMCLLLVVCFICIGEASYKYTSRYAYTGTIGGRPNILMYI